MLYILTGEIQTGKTRWLESLIDELGARGVVCDGVVAPGVWRARSASETAATEGSAGTGAFEKLGIDNRLLPEGTLVHFARRRDLACDEGTFDPSSQSGQARLGWSISDEALARVDERFEQLGEQRGIEDGRPHMLIVDELGRLELMLGEGLEHACALVSAGPSRRFPHALIVVRAQLADRAYELFAPAWDDISVIGPTDDARDAILRTVAS